MIRLRAALGLLAGLLLVLSTGMHGYAGWAHMQGRLEALQAPGDLQLGLQFGWMLGSLAMLVFGLIALWTCAQRWRGIAAAAMPLWLIAAGYGGYGLWALLRSDFQPGLLVFIVPAVLLAIAAPASTTHDSSAGHT